jgi:hypothetical protein
MRRKRVLYETIKALADKGAAIPPELLVPPRRQVSDLRRGILFITAGASIMVSLLLLHHNAWGLGVIPLFIGVGYVTVWKIESVRHNGTK